MRHIIPFLYIFLCIGSIGVSAQNPRKVIVESEYLFPFEPLWDRYRAGSLAQVAEYVNQWKQYDSINLIMCYKPSLGYRIYHHLVDSTLEQRVLNYFHPYAAVDSVQNAIDFDLMPQSQDFQNKYKDDINGIKRFFATPIATINDTLRIEDSYYGPSAYASLFHDFQLYVSKADISLFAPPQKSGVFTGQIYIKDIYQTFSFDNDLVVLEMKGDEIKDLLEQIYNKRFYKLQNENSDLVKFKTPYYLHISVAGVSFDVNLTKKKMIHNLSLNMDERYTVVANSFIAKKIVENYSCIGDYRILLLRWLKESYDNSPPKNTETWRLIPERWVEQIVKRERNTMQ